MGRQAETWVVVFLCTLFVSILFTTTTRAMPMFARKYNVSCSTCHTTAPRLNETGYRFRAAGFRMPEEIGRTSEEPFDILDYFSVRLQVRTGATRSKIGPLTTTNHQTLVQALEFYPLTGSWGKYFSSNIKVTFQPVSSPAVAIENLYAKVNRGNEHHFFSARAGAFHPYDGFGGSDSPATISRPLFQTTAANLNQSTFFPTWGLDSSGVEVGFDSGRNSVRATVFSGAVVSNQDGRFSVTAGPLAKPSAGPTYNAPDFQLFVNHVLNPKGGGLSFQYYHGNLSLPIAGTPNFFRNNFDRAAIYASYPVMKRLQLFGAYQYGRDHTFNRTSFSSGGTFAEASVPIKGMTAAGVRYDWFDPARPKVNNEISGVTAYVNAWFFSQLRIIGQYQHLRTKRESLPTQTDDAFQIRIIYFK